MQRRFGVLVLLLGLSLGCAGGFANLDGGAGRPWLPAPSLQPRGGSTVRRVGRSALPQIAYPKVAADSARTAREIEDVLGGLIELFVNPFHF